VRNVLIRGDDVLVATEFIDGVRWSELAQGVPPELALRVFLDVLAGLSALHNLRDAKRQPLRFIHGELTPDCVIIGLDGVARIVGSCRAKSADPPPGRAGSGYLAPEVLLADDSADARADLFGVGVMLWEALSEKPLFDMKTQPSALVTRVLGGHVPPASVPIQSPWAAPLVGPIARALSADPEKRFASAPAMAAELRRIAGPRLAPPSRLAAHVRTNFGEKIATRRDHLERSPGRAPEVSHVEAQMTPSTDEIPVSVRLPSDAPTPVPPSLEPAVTAARTTQASEAKPLAPPARPAPPQPPVLRPRLPTLDGMAPPLPLAAKNAALPGPPAAAPSSIPTPAGSVSLFDENPSSIHVPAAPRVPSDLAAAALALSTVDPLPVHRSPPPKTQARGSPAPATPAPSPRRRPLLVVLFVVPAILAGLLVAWVATRPDARATSVPAAGPAPTTPRTTPTSSSIAPAVVLAVPATASTPATPATPATASTASPAALPATSAPATALSPAARPPVTPAAVPGASPAAPSSRAAAPPPPARRARPKYEPEGI
jgi:serine/threonine-protein kinase